MQIFLNLLIKGSNFSNQANLEQTLLDKLAGKAVQRHVSPNGYFFYQSADTLHKNIFAN